MMHLAEGDAKTDAKTYGKVYVSAGSDDVADSGIGAGVFAVGGADVHGI